MVGKFEILILLRLSERVGARLIFVSCGDANRIPTLFAKSAKEGGAPLRFNFSAQRGYHSV